MGQGAGWKATHRSADYARELRQRKKDGTFKDERFSFNKPAPEEVDTKPISSALMGNEQRAYERYLKHYLQSGEHIIQPAGKDKYTVALYSERNGEVVVDTVKTSQLVKKIETDLKFSEFDIQQKSLWNFDQYAKTWRGSHFDSDLAQYGGSLSKAFDSEKQYYELKQRLLKRELEYAKTLV